MLKIKKNGVIHSGEVRWKYEEDDSSVIFAGWVKVKFGPVTKKFDVDDHYHIPAEKMLSANVKQGDTVTIDKTSFHFLSVAAGIAYCHVQSDEYYGMIELDLSHKYVDIIKTNMRANYSGMKLTILAERV